MSIEERQKNDLRTIASQMGYPVAADIAPWEKVRIPYSLRNVKAGTHYLLVRIPEKNIRGQESDEIAVEPGRFTEYSMFLVTF